MCVYVLLLHAIAYRNQKRAVDLLMELLLWVVGQSGGWEPNSCPLEREAVSSAKQFLHNK